MKIKSAIFFAGLAFSSQSIAQTTLMKNLEVNAMLDMVSKSQCAAQDWPHRRGRAPAAYIQGVALVFARAICQPDREDTKVVSTAADPRKHSDDALAVYQAEFKRLGMLNDVDGLNTLRHSYTLLIGLGMMESSGRYCEGRDVSECFATSESAEAGPFQTSYGARRFSPVLPAMFKRYLTSRDGCFREVFDDSIVCEIHRSHNKQCINENSDVKGTGAGADWQRLTKTCPAFATEYSAVVMRRHGGSRGEFNPIRKQQVRLAPACDVMLSKVQTYVVQHRGICAAINN